MDPLSIAASIVGLLAAASKVSSLITVIIGRAKEARRQAENVLREVNDIRLCLAQLQIFLSESTVASASHAKLVMVDQIMVVLTACVITFSELEEVVTTLQVDQPLRVPMKVRWAMKEQEVLRLLSRLQNSKASLNFMLTALTCTSFEEAQTSIIRLTALVQQVLESHEDISKRLANMETPSSIKRNIDSEVCSIDENRDNTLLVMENPNLGGGIEPADHLKSCYRFSFEPDLLSSRVYVRATIRQSRLLLPNHDAPSVECSLLSDISIAEVSDISVLSLPISASEIWNHHHYATNISPERRLGNSFGTCSPQPEMRLQHIPGKILLLGTSLAGKTTVVRQLQNFYVGGFTASDRTEARAAILNSLVNAFQGAWIRLTRLDVNFDNDGNKLLEYFQVLNYFQTDSQLNDFYNPDFLSAVKSLWRHRGVRKILTTKYWPGLDDNIQFFMSNIDDLLNPDYILSNEEVLLSPIRTTGARTLCVDINNFHCKVLDVGGVRSERWKWAHHYANTDYVIFVVSLPGYYQTFSEDRNLTQMADSMATFEDITRDESLKTKPILLFLNKVDKFMEKLADIPISDYFSDYNGGASYAKACEYFAQQFKSLDRRKDGLLHLYLTNVANTESFMGTLRCLRSTVLKENLMISVF